MSFSSRRGEGGEGGIYDLQEMDNEVTMGFAAQSHKLRGSLTVEHVTDHIIGSEDLAVLKLIVNSPEVKPIHDEENHLTSPPLGLMRGLSRRLSSSFSGSPVASPETPQPPSPNSSLLKSFSRRFSLSGRGPLAFQDTEPSSRMASLATTAEVETEAEEKEEEAGSSSTGKNPTAIRKTTWKSMRNKVTLDGRVSLERNLRDNISDPDLNVVMKLAHNLIDSKHHSSAAAWSGALLMEWAVYRGFQLTPAEQHLLGKAHAEVWISRGMGGEQYNLDRAKSLYEACINSQQQEITDAALWVEYSRVLAYHGDRETSASILKQVITTFAEDPDLTSYLFCLGAALKACEQHEEASNYFFEATMTGPPKHFNKLQMMFIISRNIEEEQRHSDEASDDAYLMVYQHLVMEGIVPESLLYDDWISDSTTWRQLGDMCALHGAHSLSCDLYGQGLMRDPLAFKKPKLWFGFAKACKRCGRTADAQLAIKQALTIEPFNQQLLRAAEMSATHTHEFESLIEEDLEAILATLPPMKHSGFSGALKLQAVQRGKVMRKSFRVALGGRTDIKKRMLARTGVLLGDSHPVLLTAIASWIGSVSEIVATDINGQSARLKFKNPFTPIKETGLPRRLSLTLEAQPDEKYDRHILTLKFIDQDTGEYLRRSLTLSFREHDKDGHLMHTVHKMGQLEDEETDKVAECHSSTEWSLLESLRFKDDHDIRTNIVDANVEQGCFVHHRVSYLYHVFNREHHTNVKIFQVCSDRQIVFQMQREHLDRNKELTKSVVKLMDIVHAYPRLQDIMLGRKKNSESSNETISFDPEGLWNNTHGNREGVIYNKKMLVLVRILPEKEGQTIVRLFEATGCPLLGHAIEDVDPEALVQDLPSRQKRLKREREMASILASEIISANPLFLAPIEAIVVVESSTPRDGDDREAGLADTDVAASLLPSSYPLPTTDENRALGGEENSNRSSVDGGGPDDAHSGLTGEDALGGESSSAVMRNLRRIGGRIRHHAMGDSPCDSPVSGTPRMPGTPTVVRFDDSVAGSDEGGVGADCSNLELGEGSADESPLAKRARKRKAKAEKEKDEFDREDNKTSEPTVIKFKSKTKEPTVPNKTFPSQPMRPRAVPIQPKQAHPEQAEKMRRQKEEQKRAKEQAAQQAVRYMLHQQAVNDAKEYVFDRSRKAQWRLGIEEARSFLLQRVALAKQKYQDLLAAQAAQEAADLAAKIKVAEDEAYEATKQSILKSKSAAMGTRTSVKGKSGSKVVSSTRVSIKPSKKVGSGGKDGSLDPALFDPAFLSGDALEATDESFDPVTDGVEGGEQIDDCNVPYSASGDNKTDTDLRGAEIGADSIVAYNGGDDDVALSPEDADAFDSAAVQFKPKRARQSIPLARASPLRPPKKITINHPPALTARQKQGLRRTWEPSDVPPWAYDDPKDLVSMLQGFFSYPSAAHVLSTPNLSDAAVPTLDDPFSAAVGSVMCTDVEQFPTRQPQLEKADYGTEDCIRAAFAAEAKIFSSQQAGEPALVESREAETESPTAQHQSAQPNSVSCDSWDCANVADGVTPICHIDSSGTTVPGPAAEYVPSVAKPSSDPVQAIPRSRYSHLPPHLKALLVPSSVKACFDPLSRVVASGELGSLKVLRALLICIKSSDLDTVSRPMPINARHSSSAFQKGGLMEVSVTEDTPRIEAFKRQQLKYQQQRNGAASLSQRPLLVGGSIGLNSGGGPARSLSTVGRAAHAEKIVPTKHSHSPFAPSRHLDPLAFLSDGFGIDSAHAGMSSLDTYDTRGYTDGASPYSSLWRLKLMRCGDIFPQPLVLQKRIASLQRSCPQHVSKLEAFCALADSGGSASEALGRLGDVEFLREIKTVCALLPVANILTKYAGDFSGLGGLLLNQENEVEAATTATGLSVASVYSHRTPRPFRAVSESPLMREVRGVVTATPTLNEAILFDTSSNLEPLRPYNNAAGCPSAPRISGTDARRLLPHLNMSQSSSIVQSRGTTIRLTGKSEPPRLQPRVSPMSAAGMGLGVGTGVAIDSDPTTSAAIPEREIPLLAEGSLLSTLSPVSATKRREQAFMAVDSDNRVAPVVPYTKSMRLTQAINVLYEQAPTTMVVMCRRDAIRAATEGVLERSPHKKIREAATKRARAWEQYSKKLQKFIG